MNSHLGPEYEPDQESVSEHLERLKKQVSKLKWAPEEGNGRTTACVNSLAGMMHAINEGVPLEEWTDSIQCIHETLRELSIEINDECWTNKNNVPVSQNKATEWMHATAPKLLGTANIPDEALWLAYLGMAFNEIFFEAYGIPPSTIPLTENTTNAFLAERRNAVLDHVKIQDTKNYLVDAVRDSGDLVSSACSLLAPLSHSKRRCYATRLLDNLCALKDAT